MEKAMYLDKGKPVIHTGKQTLSDGSTVWNIHFRGGQEEHEIIHCTSEKSADEAFILMAKAIEIATGERPLIL